VEEEVVFLSTFIRSAVLRKEVEALVGHLLCDLRRYLTWWPWGGIIIVDAGAKEL